MLRKLVIKLLRKLIREELKKAYYAGINKGYELGWMMRQSEETNKGFITGNKLDQELDEILKEAGQK